MGATDDPGTSDRLTRKRHWTTIVLEQQPDGRWLATQDGVAVEGHGETAAAAATDYCRRIDGQR